MYITEETKEAMFELLRLTFQGNSNADSIAYWLDFNGFVNAQEIFHEKYAHLFPQLADKISDILVKMGVRPIRKALQENTEDYENIVLAFSDVKLFFEKYREYVKECISISEMNEDIEIKVMLENFILDDLSILLKQVNIWEIKAKQMESKPEQFDEFFESFTII